MATKRIVFSAGLFVLTTQLSSCFLFFTDPPEGPSYSFAVTATIYPSKADTINIGDTLYLLSSFTTKLSDINTGVTVDYSQSKDLAGAIGFNDFNKFGTSTDSSTTKYFEYVKIDGDVYNDTSMPVFWSSNRTKYDETNGSYNLKIGMIPKKKGTYSFVIADLYSNGQVGKNNSASFSIKLVNINQHLEYFEDRFGTLSDNDKGKIYCFVVN